jgi:ubiquitin C-terminal hydrolase
MSIRPQQNPKGLWNLGNTCYMNSTMQCLAHTIPLTQYFLNGQYDLVKGDVMSPVLDAWKQLLCNIWCRDEKVCNPSLIRGILGQEDSKFMNRQQQDAQELLVKLLDRMDIESQIIQNPTIYRKLFYGEFRNKITCTFGHISYPPNEQFNILQLPLPPPSYNQSLNDCITFYEQTSDLADSNAYACEQCMVDGGPSFRVNATKLTKIDKCPDILIIQLKRFNEALIKNSQTISIPEKLDMTNHIMDDVNKIDAMYNLYGMVIHHGDNMQGGHYTSRIKHNNRWYNISDDRVSPDSTYNDDTTKQNAYLLFYQRKDIMLDMMKKYLKYDKNSEAISPSLNIWHAKYLKYKAKYLALKRTLSL